MLWQYYAFMGLMITTLVLWAIIAIRDDGYREEEEGPAKSDESTAPGKENESQEGNGGGK